MEAKVNAIMGFLKIYVNKEYSALGRLKMQHDRFYIEDSAIFFDSFNISCPIYSLLYPFVHFSHL